MFYKKMGRFLFLQENGAGSRFTRKWGEFDFEIRYLDVVVILNTIINSDLT